MNFLYPPALISWAILLTLIAGLGSLKGDRKEDRE